MSMLHGLLLLLSVGEVSYASAQENLYIIVPIDLPHLLQNLLDVKIATRLLV